MKLDSLDDLSRDFARHLFARYPEWEAHAKAVRYSGDPMDHLDVEIPAPERDTPPLIITTENSEVTIFYGDCHGHFDWPVTDTTACYIVDPLICIEAILNEEYATMSCWDGNEWISAWWLEPGQDPDKEAPGRASRIRVRSWRGSRNYDFDLGRD